MKENLIVETKKKFLRFSQVREKITRNINVHFCAGNILKPLLFLLNSAERNLVSFQGFFFAMKKKKIQK